MRAYKFLQKDRTTVITGFTWPVGEWVEVDGPLAWCGNGIHACRIEDLPHWLGPELWAMDVEGELHPAPDAVVARRGRLVAHVDAWSGGVAQEFADSCARWAGALAADNPSATGRADDAAADAAIGWIGGAAYVTAAVAGEVASGSRSGPLYERSFLAERTRQARWLQDRLGLSDS